MNKSNKHLNEDSTKKKLTNWKKEPSFDDLSKDYIASNTDQESRRDNITRWNLNRDGGKEITARPGKSTARPKVIRKQQEWKYPAIEEPFVNTKDMFDIQPRRADDIEAAEQNKIIINYQWSTKINKVELVGEIVRTVVDEGTVIVKTGWKTEDGTKTIEEERPIYASKEESYSLIQKAVAEGVIEPEKAQAMIETGELLQTGSEKVYVEKTTLIKNEPTYEVCNNANTIIDPTCEGRLSDAQFIIHEYSTTLSDLKKKEYKTWTTIDEETGEKIKHEKGIYKNLDDIPLDANNVKNQYISESAQNMIFDDKARKKLTAFDYWGYWDIHGNGITTAIVATWIDGVMIRMEENPFPHKRLPFSVATYMPVKREVFGEPDCELLIENQESIGRSTRAAHDIMASQAVGQEFIDENLFTPVQRENYNNGDTVFFRTGLNPKTAIHRTSVESVPNAVFQMIDLQTKDAESMSGTTTFGTSIGQKSATGEKRESSSISKRESSILRRLSDMLFKDMARMTISMNQAYMPEEDVVRITNNEFVTIRRDDLAGEFDLKIDVSTPEKDDEKANKLMVLMQTNQANMNFELQKIMYTKLLNLWKLPEEAEQVKQFEPKPDEKAELAKNLEIENLKLENELKKKLIEESDSRINERMSRVIENERDVENKFAQMELRLQQKIESQARTRKLESETDEIDRQHLDEIYGTKRDKEFEDKLAEAEIEMSKEETRAEIQRLQEKLDSNEKEETNEENEISKKNEKYKTNEKEGDKNGK